MKFKKLSKLALVLSITGATVLSSVPSSALLNIPVNVYANEIVAQSEIDAIIKEKISKMTTEQKIGQMIQPDFRQWKTSEDTEVQDLTVLNDEVKAIIDEYDLGGVILFANNVKETAQTATLVHDLQEVIKNDESNDIPLLITVDQEGGIVTRLGTGTNLPGNMALGATRSSKYAYNAGSIIGSELNSLGINVNFAPVLDVNNNPANPVINVRSISSDPNLVGTLGSALIKGIQDQGVVATAKHFPGHGDTATDSHYGLPIVDKSLEELNKTELVPFKTAIEEGVDMIMTAHIGMPQIEDEVIQGTTLPLPATLSDDIMTGLLREKLGYNGVVITDALNMDAISKNMTESEAVIKTINAGVDIALMPTVLRSNEDVHKLQTILDDVVEAVNTGRISEDRLDESVERILKLKVERGIWNPIGATEEKTLEEKIANAEAIVGNKKHKAMEKEIAEAAVTLVKNENKALPFKPKKGENVLVIAYGTSQTDSMVNSINNLVESRKIKNVNVDSYNFNSKSANSNLEILDENLKAKIENADYIIATSTVSNASRLSQTSYWNYVPRAILNYANELGKKSTLLSVRNPYDVATTPEAKAQVLIYGDKGDPNGPDSEAGNQLSAGPNLPAGINAIFGQFKPSGKLPVEVPVVAKDGTIQDEVYLPLGYGLKNWGASNNKPGHENNNKPGHGNNKPGNNKPGNGNNKPGHK